MVHVFYVIPSNTWVNLTTLGTFVTIIFHVLTIPKANLDLNLDYIRSQLNFMVRCKFLWLNLMDYAGSILYGILLCFLYIEWNT